MRRLVLLALVISLPSLALAQFVRVEGSRFVRPDGSTLHIKGTNLGNWLVPEGYMWQLEDGVTASPREIETLVALLLGPDRSAAFWRDYRARYITEADIRFLAATGLNTLRVPLHYKFFTTDDGEGFALLDRLAGWCRDAGLSLILGLHCAPGGQTGTNIDDSLGYPWLFESPSAQEQFLQVWRRIAHHYRDEPVILGYDLLNEPLPHFKGWEHLQPKLDPLLRRALAEVRAVDPHHIVFFTGSHWGSDFSVLGAPPAPNLAYTFHKYWQPAKQSSIQPYLDFRTQHNVPLWLGESGENKDAWIAQFRTLLDQHDIGWTFWPYKKMGSAVGFVRFAPPVHWEKVQAFAARNRGTTDVEADQSRRPTPAEIEACFTDLLRQIEFAHCVANPGYLTALGLQVPPAGP